MIYNQIYSISIVYNRLHMFRRIPTLSLWFDENSPNRTDIPHLDEEEYKNRYTNCAFRNDDEPNRSQSCIE